MTGTCAENVKTIITSFDWTSVTYGETPEIAIEGIDSLDQYSPDHHIFLRDDTEEPDFTVNAQYIQSPKTCMLELIERNPTKRTNLYEGLKTCFQQSGYGVTFSRVRPENLRQPYQITLQVNILL